MTDPPSVRCQGGSGRVDGLLGRHVDRFVLDVDGLYAWTRPAHTPSQTCPKMEENFQRCEVDSTIMADAFPWAVTEPDNWQLSPSEQLITALPSESLLKLYEVTKTDGVGLCGRESQGRRLLHTAQTASTRVEQDAVRGPRLSIPRAGDHNVKVAVAVDVRERS